MPVQTIITKPRKCGLRKEHALYLVGGDSKSENGVLQPFTLIDPPVPYQVHPHRGPRIVDANAILGRRPIDEWWFGSSKKTEEKKQGDAWAIETFGMTLAQRLRIGICAGTASADEALDKLAKAIMLEPSIHLTKAMQTLALEGLPELTSAASHYISLHENISMFFREPTVLKLIGAQAALWKIAYNVPPKKRETYIPHLMRLLVLMNLRQDASAMRAQFLP